MRPEPNQQINTLRIKTGVRRAISKRTKTTIEDFIGSGFGKSYPDYSYLEDLMCYVIGVAAAVKSWDHPRMVIRIDKRWGVYVEIFPFGTMVPSVHSGKLGTPSLITALERLLLQLIGAE